MEYWERKVSVLTRVGCRHPKDELLVLARGKHRSLLGQELKRQRVPGTQDSGSNQVFFFFEEFIRYLHNYRYVDSLIAKYRLSRLTLDTQQSSPVMCFENPWVLLRSPAWVPNSGIR